MPIKWLSPRRLLVLVILVLVLLGIVILESSLCELLANIFGPWLSLNEASERFAVGEW